MFKHLLLGAALFLAAPGLWAQNASLSAPLQAQMERDDPTWIDISLLMRDQADLQAVQARWRQRRPSPEVRSSTVIGLLQQKAADTQPALLSVLEQDPEIMPGSVRAFWIANVVFVYARPAAIARLALNPDIAAIDLNHPVWQEATACDAMIPDQVMAPGGRTPGLSVIGAPELWAMGYTGYGRVAMSLDTGVDPDHPALSRQYRGRFVNPQESWFQYNSSNFLPFDCDGHGTHTVGTMVGLDRANHDTIGVAFGGLWIGSPGLCSGSGASLTDRTIATFQWALNPDGNPGTASDMPDVINNSWFNSGLTGECQSLYVQALTALETAGIAVVFSAGNAGPGVSTITPPKNINTGLVNSFAVGAVSGSAANTPVANFSSRGPAICAVDSGSLLIKPEVSAPGVGVRSSLPGGGYGNLSGTSMAAPHAAGAILLLKEAFPYLTGEELKLALYFSATDLGAPGEDNQYGMGLINLPAAFAYLTSQGHIPVVPRNEVNVAIEEVLNLPEKLCQPRPMPLIVLKNEGNQPITSAKIATSYSQGFRDTLHWTGSIPVGGVAPMLVMGPALPSGSYTFRAEALLVNGQPDDRPLDNFTTAHFQVLTGPRPAAQPTGAACTGARALLKTQTPFGTTRWYDQPVGGQLLGYGNTFLSPPVLSDTAFFAEGIEVFSVGITDTFGLPVAIGAGGESLRLAAHRSGALESVKVILEFPGVLFFNLNDTTGANLASRAIFLFSGTHVVPLDFELAAGAHYVLQVVGGSSLAGIPSGVSYPMAAGNALTILGGEVAGAYPGLFDLRFANNPSCERIRVPVLAQGNPLSVLMGISDTLVNISSGQAVQFTDFSTGAVRRLWNFGDGTTDTQQVVLHRFNQAGKYLVTLEVESVSGCLASAAGQITAFGSRPTAVLPATGNEVSLFPNPNPGWWRMHFGTMIAKNVHLTLLDLAGRTVWSDQRSLPADGNLEVTVGNLPAGVYSLRWRAGASQGAILVRIGQAD